MEYLDLGTSFRYRAECGAIYDAPVRSSSPAPSLDNRRHLRIGCGFHQVAVETLAQTQTI